MDNSNSSKTIILTGVQKPFLERNEILSMYYHEIQSFNPLPHEEIVQLFEKYRHGTGHEKAMAREKIFKHNTKLVVSMARKYASIYDNLLDLIEEGNIGLLNAIERFNPNKNSSFQKFALYHIRREINLFKVNGTPTVKQTNRSKCDGRVKSIVSKFQQKEERTPTEEEILLEYNRQNPTNKLRDTGDVINVEYVHLDSLQPVNGDILDSQDYIDYSNKTASDNDSIKLFNNQARTELVRVLMKELQPQEKEALNLFYGLEDGIQLPLMGIATRMNCSSERVRQLCKNAIKKMQRKIKEQAYAKHCRKR